MIWCVLTILVTLIPYLITQLLIPCNIWFSRENTAKHIFTIWPPSKDQSESQEESSALDRMFRAPGDEALVSYTVMPWLLGSLNAQQLYLSSFVFSLASSALSVYLYRWASEAKEVKWSAAESQLHRISSLGLQVPHSALNLYHASPYPAPPTPAKNVCYPFVDVYIPIVVVVSFMVSCVKR